MARVLLRLGRMSVDLPLPHEKLLAYRLAIDLLKQVQALDVSDPRLRDQILRASKSVCLNIAEGVGRFSDADRRRVYAIARGECCETAAAIDIARAIGECDVEAGRTARDMAGRVYALLTGLVRRFDSDTPDPKRNECPTPALAPALAPARVPNTGTSTSTSTSTSPENRTGTSTGTSPENLDGH